MIGDDAILCARVPSARRVGNNGAGWLHPLNIGAPGAAALRKARIDPPRPGAPINWSKMVDAYVAALPDVCSLADELGVSNESLGRLELGWSLRCNAYTFPMRDASDRIIGVRTRSLSGDKRAILDSRNGLFIPRRLPDNATEVYICEGPTDCAAMLDCGVASIGRPSSTGGMMHLVGWLRVHPRIRNVTICVDRDTDPVAIAATESGATLLEESLIRIGRATRILRPPPRCKDVRQWVRTGLSARGLKSISDDTAYTLTP